MSPSLQNPRNIHPEETFRALVADIKEKAIQTNAPGALIGISGTDSILTFLACYEAFKQLGKADQVKGVTFTHKTKNIGDNPKGPFECVGDDHGWVTEEIWPWLKERAPEATLTIDDSIEHSDDAMRWGKLRSLAIADTKDGQNMQDDHYFVIGTHNATEKYLGNYSVPSMSTSMEPLSTLYKSEVLILCESLDVPQIALEKSREIDCDCGRFDVLAHNLNEVDAYILSKQNPELEELLQTIDPDTLNAVQALCIEERNTNAFRSTIPYTPAKNLVVQNDASYQNAFEAAQNGGIYSEIKPVTRMVPRIIRQNDANIAHKIVTDPAKGRPLWRPEAFALMATPNLTIEQKAEMNRAIFQFHEHIQPDATTTQDISKLTADIGALCFSFPTWRFVAQGMGQKSLIELYGMEKLKRDTDVLDPDLPFWNPERDELGTGFMWSHDNWYVELRRSYIAFTERAQGQETSLIIRNSSFFYGRDRLDDPVYVSYNAVSNQDMQDLSAEKLHNGEHGFIPFEQALGNAGTPEELQKNIERTQHAHHMLTSFDKRFSLWMKSNTPDFREKGIPAALSAAFNHETGGLEHLESFLHTLFLKHAEGKKPGAPLTLASLAPNTPPWRPQHATPADHNTISAIHAFRETGKIEDSTLKSLLKPSPMDGSRLVLLSGPYGDFPATPG